MDWKFNNASPLYLQVAAQLKDAILTGIYKPGDKLPSVREISLECKVTPNTIMASLALLENQGYIMTKSTSGKFVCENLSFINDKKEKEAEERTQAYLADMKKFGYSLDEILTIIKKEEIK